jgi:hypothetical protein
VAITEQSRYELHQVLEEIMGKERATTLMEHLPPVGWADVATKTDIAHAVELVQMTMRTELHRGLYHQAGLIAVMLTVLFTALKLT